MADAVAEVKARLDIVEVIGGYVRLQRSGRDHKGLCPFHSERTPSFSVSQDKQAWYCFGCTEGGDILSFVQRIEHVDFMGALEMLAERAGVELERDSPVDRQRGQARRRRLRVLELNARAQAFYEHILWSSPAGDPGRALLAERGVTEGIARDFGVGFAPAGGGGGDALLRYLGARALGTAAEAAEAGLAHTADRGGLPRDRFRNRLVFPIRDERGDVLGFGGRALGDAVPKYLNSPATSAYDKSLALFGIDRARTPIESAGCAVVVEGYFDVLASATAGVGHAVASSGTALTTGQVRLLARWTRTLVLCFDGDDAGTTASSRAVDVIAAEGLDARICVLPPGFKDPDELVRRDPAGFAACVAGALPEWRVLLDRAIGDAEAGSVEERRAGAERALAVLARIPEATVRDLYVQQAASRLALTASAVGADVERLRGERGRTPLRVVVTPPAAPLEQVPVIEVTGGAPVAAWEEYLGSVVVQRPGLATRLLAEQGLRHEEIVHPSVRRLVEIAAALPEDGQLSLHGLAAPEQRLAARLLLRPVPELREDAPVELLGRAVADCVRRVRDAALRTALATLKRELRMARDDGRTELAQRLAARLHELASEGHRAREAVQ
ncbi:MAG TPA: DNA primase [Candidatus Dormibacteraeota bacterium]|jgi:DNA primase|nr:DNA primase [Candidatus Dormibacteraeota bacterium]